MQRQCLKEILQRTLEETLGTELGNAVKMVDHKRNNNTLKTLFKNLSDRVEQMEKWEKKRLRDLHFTRWQKICW